MPSWITGRDCMFGLPCNLPIRLPIDLPFKCLICPSTCLSVCPLICLSVVWHCLQDFDTRVVVVSSAGHAIMDHWKGLDFADMHFKEGRTYSKMNAYGQSKSANILFAKQIAVR